MVGWSYLVLVHSDLQYDSWFTGLAHMYVAEMLLHSLWETPVSRPDAEVFAKTYSLVFMLFLCCVAGALTSRIAASKMKDIEDSRPNK